MQRRLNSEELVKRAKKIADKIYAREKLCLPVDVVSVLEKYAEIVTDDISFADAVCIYSKKPLIVCDTKNVVETRFRFTLAHELGHVIIPWHDGIISCHTGQESIMEEIDDKEYQELEKQANAFAAEFLMPSDYVKTVIKNNETKGLKKVIEVLCYKCNVSFLASMYSVVNMLPKGYFIYIDRIYDGYSQKKFSKDTELIMLYDKDDKSDFSREWLEINCINSSEIIRSSESIYWVNVGNTLEKDELKRLLKNIGNLTEIFKILFDKKKLSPAISLTEICRILPSGYIIFIESIDKKYSKEIKSQKTYINPCLCEKSVDSKHEWNDNNSIKHGVYQIKNFRILWWKFDSFMKIKEVTNEHRSANLILNNIVNESYYDWERKKVFGTIHGVIGALNNKIDKYSRDEFYGILKQKFISRENLRPITQHSDFDIFLAIKTNELYNKNK